jgi:hypothetical protein
VIPALTNLGAPRDDLALCKVARHLGASLDAVLRTGFEPWAE